MPVAQHLPGSWTKALRRRPTLPLLTGLAALVTITVLARPTALFTFGLISIAGTLFSKRSAH